MRIRDGVNFKHNTGCLRAKYYSIVEALRQEEEMYELIRKSEDGAHDKLQEENANLNQIYDLKYIRKIIKTIKNSYPALVRLLNSDENKEENTELAKDFFPIHKPKVITTGGGGGGGGGGGNPPNPNKTRDLITCTPGKNSFSWTPSADYGESDLEEYYKKGIRWQITFLPLSMKKK